jgi:hypothetical protein
VLSVILYEYGNLSRTLGEGRRLRGPKAEHWERYVIFDRKREGSDGEKLKERDQVKDLEIDVRNIIN